LRHIEKKHGGLEGTCGVQGGASTFDRPSEKPRKRGKSTREWLAIDYSQKGIEKDKGKRGGGLGKYL